MLHHLLHCRRLVVFLPGMETVVKGSDTVIEQRIFQGGSLIY